ncbi:MAG: hypothetical protein ACRELX_14575, partial [Longimicrobiales bacterium]
MRVPFRMIPRATLSLAAVLACSLTACGRDAPNRAGGPLLPGGAVRTFEVVVDPARYLVRDTSFAGYGTPWDVTYLIIAQDYQDRLDAHALARFEIPTAIAAPDSGGTVRTDSTPTFSSGTVALFIDSVRTATAGPLQFELYRLAEEWDPQSATWALRVDTAETQHSWAEPGGTRGALIDTATWSAADGDTVFFDVDSATIEAWRDTLDLSRGALVRIVNGGERVRAAEILMRIDARPSFRPDTVVTTTIRPPDRTFVFDPPIETVAGAPMIGGVTAWRTMLLLKQRLDTLSVTCPDGPPGCTLLLRETTVNYAALLLDPVAPPPGFPPEDSLVISARVLLESPAVPLARSLLSAPAGSTPRPLSPARLS